MIETDRIFELANFAFDRWKWFFFKRRNYDQFRFSRHKLYYSYNVIISPSPLLLISKHLDVTDTIPIHTTHSENVLRNSLTRVRIFTFVENRVIIKRLCVKNIKCQVLYIVFKLTAAPSILCRCHATRYGVKLPYDLTKKEAPRQFMHYFLDVSRKSFRYISGKSRRFSDNEIILNSRVVSFSAA